MKNKKIILGCGIGIIIIIAFIVVINIFNSMGNKPENDVSSEIKYNKNESFIEDKTIGDISFTNIECMYDGVDTLLQYTVTNNSDVAIKLNEYEITVKDKEGKVLAIITPVINEELLPNESYDLGNAIDIDLSEAVTLDLVLAN